jgi:hypothetical protein
MTQQLAGQELADQGNANDREAWWKDTLITRTPGKSRFLKDGLQEWIASMHTGLRAFAVADVSLRGSPRKKSVRKRKNPVN